MKPKVVLVVSPDFHSFHAYVHRLSRELSLDIEMHEIDAYIAGTRYRLITEPWAMCSFNGVEVVLIEKERLKNLSEFERKAEETRAPRGEWSTDMWKDAIKPKSKLGAKEQS